MYEDTEMPRTVVNILNFSKEKPTIKTSKRTIIIIIWVNVKVKLKLSH